MTTHATNNTTIAAATEETSVSDSILPSDDWIEDIDHTSITGCGTFKCALKSKSNNAEQGYLVTPLLERDEIQMHHDLFEMANNLTQDFGIEHSLLSAPLEFKNAPGWLFEVLSNHTRKPTSDEIRERKHSYMTSANRSVLVQPIQLYSPQSLLFLCRKSKRSRKYLMKIKKFNATTFGENSSNIRNYANRLRRDLSRTIALMENSTSHWSNCLSKDFQVVIDPLQGRLVHIDLDRCFGTNPMIPRWNSDCKNTLTDLVEKTIYKRQKVMRSSKASTTG